MNIKPFIREVPDWVRKKETVGFIYTLLCNTYGIVFTNKEVLVNVQKNLVLLNQESYIK